MRSDEPFELPRWPESLPPIEMPLLANETLPSVTSTAIDASESGTAALRSSSGMPAAWGPTPATTTITRSSFSRTRYSQSLGRFQCCNVLVPLEGSAWAFPQFASQV